MVGTRNDRSPTRPDQFRWGEARARRRPSPASRDRGRRRLRRARPRPLLSHPHHQSPPRRPRGPADPGRAPSWRPDRSLARSRTSGSRPVLRPRRSSETADGRGLVRRHPPRFGCGDARPLPLRRRRPQPPRTTTHESAPPTRPRRARRGRPAVRSRRPRRRPAQPLRPRPPQRRRGNRPLDPPRNPLTPRPTRPRHPTSRPHRTTSPTATSPTATPPPSTRRRASPATKPSSTPTSPSTAKPATPPCPEPVTRPASTSRRRIERRTRPPSWIGRGRKSWQRARRRGDPPELADRSVGIDL